MEATFRIYCPKVRAKLEKLVREHDAFVHPLNEDEIHDNINPHQHFDWGRWHPEESRSLHVSGHRCALNSEGYRVMCALRAAEEAGKASLLAYKTSRPEMAWYETRREYLLRAPLE